MTLQLTLTHLISLGTVFIGLLLGLVKFIAYQQEKRQDERFDALTKREDERLATVTLQLDKLGNELRQEAQATLQLERQFMRFQADLPRDYVRRDDFLRSIGEIVARVDNMALRMERALSRTKEGTP